MSRLILLISLLLSAVTAMAAHCVKDTEAIDAAIARIDLSADERSQVISLRDEGMALHNNGDHRGAERKLAEGMRILLENVISSTPMEHKMGMGQGMEGGGCGMGQGGGCGMGGMDHDMDGGGCCGDMGGMDHDMEGMGDK